LNDEEVLIVANTSTQSTWSGEIIVDFSLNPADSHYQILFSNKGTPTGLGPVVERPPGSVEITEIDGTLTHGPLHVLAVSLGPMEIQILGMVEK
jgi:hypothetical protein